MDRDEVTAAPTKESSPKPEAVFKTEKIGQWQAKQDTPFEKQNREREKQKQRSKARNKKFLKVALWSGGAVVAVAAVIVTLMLTVWKTVEEEDTTPTVAMSGNTSQDIVDYRNELMDIYKETSGIDGPGLSLAGQGEGQEKIDNDKAVEVIQQTVDKTLSTPEGKRNANEVRLAQVAALFNTSNYENVVKVAERIDVDKLSLESQQSYYNLLGNAYSALGDDEAARENNRKAREIAFQIGTGQGGAL